MFTRITEAELPETGDFGAPFYTSDTGKLFIGQGEGRPLKATNAENEVMIVLTIDDLPSLGDPTLLYVVIEDSNYDNQMMIYGYNTAYVPLFINETSLVAGDGIEVEKNADTYTITNTVDGGMVGIRKVDETNIANGRVLAYDNNTTKLVYIDPPTSSGGSISLSQLTKMTVVATPEEPKVYDLEIPATSDFKRIPVEILKYIPNEQNVISTIVEFNNADATDFESVDNTVFDGTMHLLTMYESPFAEIRAFDKRKEYVVDIDVSKLKDIIALEVI
jgi:hypothetical protein